DLVRYSTASWPSRTTISSTGKALSRRARSVILISAGLSSTSRIAWTGFMVALGGRLMLGWHWPARPRTARWQRFRQHTITVPQGRGRSGRSTQANGGDRANPDRG